MTEFEGIVHYARKVTVAGARDGWPHRIRNQEAERDGRWCSAHLFIWSRTPVHGMVPHHIQSGPSHRHTPNIDDSPQGFVSQVMLDPVPLTIAVSNHNPIDLLKAGEGALQPQKKEGTSAMGRGFPVTASGAQDPPQRDSWPLTSFLCSGPNQALLLSSQSPRGT